MHVCGTGIELTCKTSIWPLSYILVSYFFFLKKKNYSTTLVYYNFPTLYTIIIFDSFVVMFRLKDSTYSTVQNMSPFPCLFYIFSLFNLFLPTCLLTIEAVTCDVSTLPKEHRQLRNSDKGKEEEEAHIIQA